MWSLGWLVSEVGTKTDMSNSAETFNGWALRGLRRTGQLWMSTYLELRVALSVFTCVSRFAVSAENCHAHDSMTVLKVAILEAIIRYVLEFTKDATHYCGATIQRYLDVESWKTTLRFRSSHIVGDCRTTRMASARPVVISQAPTISSAKTQKPISGSHMEEMR